MSKYIDAEKLKAEIERLKEGAESAKKEWVNEGYNQNAFAEDCRISSFERLLSFIDSLQQEQPTKGYDEAYLNECIAKASKSWKGVDVDKFMDEVRGREQKQPSLPSNLDDAAEEYSYDNWESEDYYDGASEGLPFDAIGHTAKCFKAGAEWMMTQMPMPEDTVLFNKGVEEGKRLMMEVAVEYEVMDFSSSLETHPQVNIPLDNKKYRAGDKVRLIVLPMEEIV